jgi:hypothetical protein
MKLISDWKRLKRVKLVASENIILMIIPTVDNYISHRRENNKATQRTKHTAYIIYTDIQFVILHMDLC